VCVCAGGGGGGCEMCFVDFDAIAIVEWTYAYACTHALACVIVVGRHFAHVTPFLPLLMRARITTAAARNRQHTQWRTPAL
jgi:hypothetical protein